MLAEDFILATTNKAWVDGRVIEQEVFKGYVVHVHSSIQLLNSIQTIEVKRRLFSIGFKSIGRRCTQLHSQLIRTKIPQHRRVAFCAGWSCQSSDVYVADGVMVIVVITNALFEDEVYVTLSCYHVNDLCFLCLGSHH